MAKIALIAVAASVGLLTTGCMDRTTGASSPVEPVATTDAPLANVDDGDSDPQALTAIREELDGNGSWSDDVDYGAVWTPDEVGFIPFVTDGRWVNVGSNDHVWLANSDWGAVTTHHGRWVATPTVAAAGANGVMRWRWVPGTKLASAWATWHSVGDRIAATPTASPVVEPAKVTEVAVRTPLPTPVVAETRSVDAPEVFVSRAVEHVDEVAAHEAAATHTEDAPRDLRMAWNSHFASGDGAHVGSGAGHAFGGSSTGHASSGGHGHGGHR
jgi:hypothetical protein